MGNENIKRIKGGKMKVRSIIKTTPISNMDEVSNSLVIESAFDDKKIILTTEHDAVVVDIEELKKAIYFVEDSFIK